MNRIYRNCLLAAISAAALLAQPPVQPVPPAPPEPPVPPVVDRLSERINERVQEQMERAREDMDRARVKMEDMRLDIEPLAGMHFDIEPMLLAQKLFSEQDARFRVHDLMDHANDRYSRGLDALDQRNYERALTSFDEYYRDMNGKKDSRADGALYWKAYTLNKLGRRDEATATLAQLEKNYPSSRWLGDAKALQLEVSQGAGRGASPEAQSDEDLKLLALGGLVHTDPERAVPLLEKLLADPKTSPRLKSRALFVLAETRNPKAGTIIAGYAKSGGNPDVQLKAVEYLGVFNTKENLQALSEIYASAGDPAVKRAVLRGYLFGKDKDHLLATAKSESNAELRQEAIRDLGALGAHVELAQMYPSETNADIRRTIIRSLSSKREKSADTLASLYSSETDKKLKGEILRSLHSQNAAKQLVDIAHKETDPGLKQEAVRELSNMRSKEAQDYMLELLSK